jgi:trehalose synthase
MDQVKSREMLPLEAHEPEFTTSIDDYREYIGQDKVDDLRRLAEPLVGKEWVNVNSTFVGGGVAEMLRSVIPLARGLGLDARWNVIRGHDKFFQVTKKFHNLLQGVDQPISMEEIFGAYLDTIDENAQNTFVTSDLVVVHDPQPAALIMNGVIFGNVLWRCHIDTSSPNKAVWRFLLPYINLCAGAIFTMPEFVGPGLQVPTYQIAPCIDPRVEKNRQYTDEEAQEVLAPLFAEHDVDPERPILAAISRYDIHKNQGAIIKAFKRLREEKKYDPPPYLILLGNTAADDPEGGAMLEQLKAETGEDVDVRFWVNVENNDQVVGALMRIARGFVHVSTKEGFGLVVAEALWQGTPVIGSCVGGIKQQVLDGKTGYLVDPHDVDAVAASMARLLDRPDEAKTLGAEGREHVRRNFLVPELVKKYLALVQFYSGKSRELPPFRLNELAYSEFVQAIRPQHPNLPSSLAGCR